MTTEVPADAAEDQPVTAGRRAAAAPARAVRPTEPTNAWRRRLLTVLVPLLVYTGVAGAYFKPTLLDGLTYGQVDDMQRVYFPWVGLQGFPVDTVFPQQDYPNSYFPRQVWLQRALRDGELPEWNPYSFAGSPFLDNGAGITFHPVRTLLTVTVSPALAHDLYLLLAMLTAGLGTHALARRLGSSHAAAYLAGTAYMLNATFLAWSQLELMAAIVAGLPWALYGLRRWSDVASAGVPPDGPPGAVGSVRPGGLRWVVFAGVVAGLMPLGGSVDFTLTAWLTCGLYAVAVSQRGLGRQLRLRERLHWRRIAAPATFTATAVALGAPALLPFVALSPYVGRAPQDPAVFETGILLPVDRFLSTFWPPELPVTSVLMHEMAFAGTLVGVLAVIGLVLRGPRALLGRALLLGAFLFIANTVVSRTAGDLVTTYRSFTVGRHLFFWNLGLALLASVALDGLFSLGRRVADRVAAPRRRAPAFGVAVAAVVATALIAVNTYQLGTYGRDMNPRFSPRDPAELMPSTPAIEALQDVDGGLGGGRFLPARFSDGAPVMSASLSMIFDLESGAGYESTFLAGVEATWRTIAGEDLEAVLASPSTLGYQAGFVLEDVRADLLARVGVTTLLLPPGAADRPDWAEVVEATGGLEQRYAGPDGEVWTLQDAPPRASVVPRVEVVADVGSALRRVLADDFPWESQVVLSPEPVTGREPAVPQGVTTVTGDAPTAEVGPGGGYADEEVYDNDQIRLRVWAPRPSYLLVRDSWAPGWTATVSGTDVPVELANGAYRAVPVPAGDSVVEFRYRTPGLRVGLALAAVALTAMLVGAVWMFWADVVRPTRRRPR